MITQLKFKKKISKNVQKNDYQKVINLKLLYAYRS